MSDVRQLVDESLTRFDTLVATFVEWHDAALTHRARTSGGEDVSTWLVARAIAPPALPRDTAGEREGVMRRVWWRKPDCWRADVYLGGELLAVNLCRGSIASSYGAGQRVMYTSDPSAPPSPRWPRGRVPVPGLPSLESERAQIALFHLPFFAEGWDVDVIDGTTALLARPAITIAARRSRSQEAGSDLHWNGFDRFVAVVDAERGFPLRLAALVDGQEAERHAVRSIRFDEPIPDEIFTFVPPAGTTVVQATTRA